MRYIVEDKLKSVASKSSRVARITQREDADEIRETLRNWGMGATDGTDDSLRFGNLQTQPQPVAR